MRLIDADNIDYVILEDSLHRIEHKKGDEIDCVIGAEIVNAIPLAKVKQAREEIAKLKHKNTDVEGYRWWNNAIENCLHEIDKLIAESE